MEIKQDTFYTEKNVSILSWILIVIGVAYRLILWQTNRGLFIDEANLARNIYERNFIGLTQPLIHEQYAPPIFLWITKFNVSIFNYDERILRLYPLFAGIVSLIILFQLLKEFVSIKNIWYSICLFATGAIYLRYSTEFKQYMPDTMICLVLVKLALQFNIEKTRNLLFCIIWIFAGSFAIWSSMSSVFILSAIGLYYFVNAIIKKEKSKIFLLVLIGSIWLAQFGYYYLKVLAPQANSAYLQNFHKWYFVDAFPNFGDFKQHNWLLLKGLTEALGGKLLVSLIFNLCLTAIGIFVLIKTKNVKGILLLIPTVLIYIASAIKSYSVTDRLMLFYMPLWLIIVGIGFDFLMQQNYRFVKWSVLIIAIFVAIKFNKISYLTSKPLDLENVPKCLDALVEKKITANELYITNLAEGAYVYYTEIHPNKDKWKALKSAHQLNWDADFKEQFKAPNQRAALLITTLGNDGTNTLVESIKMHNNIIERTDAADAHAVIFVGK